MAQSAIIELYFPDGLVNELGFLRVSGDQNINPVHIIDTTYGPLQVIVKNLLLRY